MPLVYPEVRGLSELAEYLRKLNQVYEGTFIQSEVAEEVAEDIPMASENVEVLAEGGIAKVEYSEARELEARFRYFIDGVVETRPIAKIQVRGIEVPIHLVTCGAGVFERGENGEVRPTENIVILTFLALPYSAITELDPDFKGKPQGLKLNKLKPLFDKLPAQQGPAPWLWLDTATSFGSDRRIIEKQDLISTGRVRAKARDQARVIMRVLEVGVLYLLKKSGYSKGLIAFDGPISPLYIYAKLVSNNIEGLYELSNKKVSYDMLKDVIGCVKRVYRVPHDDKFLEVFKFTKDEHVFTIYPMSGVVKPLREEERDVEGEERMLEDAIRVTFSAFTVLRPELRYFYAGSIISNASTVARFDIPLPNIVDEKSDWYLDDFVKNLFRELFPNGILNLTSDEGKKLYSILKAVVIDRFPVPASRAFTELYPIYEAEQHLKSYAKRITLNFLSMF
jgi:hypothetical protein